MEDSRKKELEKELQVLKVQHQGSLLMITARGTRSEIIEKIQAKNPLFMEVLPLTLEEILSVKRRWLVMRSRIFSSKYIKTVSKGQAWIPAFLTLGFILAFPVIGLEKLGSWRNLGYTQDQITLLYYRLWKDGFVLTGMAVAIGGRIYECSKWIPCICIPERKRIFITVFQ